MKSFDELIGNLKELPKRKRVAVVAAQDEHTLEAIVDTARMGVIEPVLIGHKDKIQEILTRLSFDSSTIEIQNIDSTEECAKQAANLARQGEIDCIMKGKTETADLMRVMVNKDYGIRISNTMSVLGFFESPYYHKIFAVTDAGLVMYPTVEQKKDIIKNAVRAFHKFGIACPKVSVLGAIEHVNPKMKETVEAQQLKDMWLQGMFPQCVVEGPISYDLAMSAEAAAIKDYSSPVAGDSDILVVPDIAVGNILGKGLLYTGGAKNAGTVLGAMVPLVFTSRSATAEDKRLSILLNAFIGRIDPV